MEMPFTGFHSTTTTARTTVLQTKGRWTSLLKRSCFTLPLCVPQDFIAKVFFKKCLALPPPFPAHLTCMLIADGHGPHGDAGPGLFLVVAWPTELLPRAAGGRGPGRMQPARPCWTSRNRGGGGGTEAVIVTLLPHSETTKALAWCKAVRTEHLVTTECWKDGKPFEMYSVFQLK